jgi:hypothetical protein
LAAIASLPILAACIPKDRAGFDAVGPARRLDAVVLAADQTDPDSLRGLIQTLDSDDPAARLLAIRALQKRTGQTLGYRYTDPPWRRAEAIQRWIAWERDLGSESPAEADSADAGTTQIDAAPPEAAATHTGGR